MKEATVITQSEPRAPTKSSVRFDVSIEVAQHNASLLRDIDYDFQHFFKSQAGLTLNFGIGPKEIKNLEMVERHYFRGKVIRSYDFKFGFVIPNSTNSWEFIYDLPELSYEDEQAIIEAPWEVKSDSFFFAEGELIIHNRAIYNYQPLV